MEKYNMFPLLETLKAKPDIFICGPSYGDSSKKAPNTKLRVYAYGGILCELPTEPGEEIKLLDKRYLKEDSLLSADLNGIRGNDKKEKFLRDHLDDLLFSMKERFTSKNGDCEERRQQTVISRAHTSFCRHNGTVVCDFQSSIPQTWLPNGMGRPTFDIVTFSVDETGNGVFTLVELKCNKTACIDSNGLQKHAKDMRNCVENHLTSDSYKKELLRRLDYMIQFDLLQDRPAGLDHPSLWHSKNVSLRTAFLFTSGTGQEGSDNVVLLCKNFIPESMLNDFFYYFAKTPEAVDLSHMESWETFSGCQ